MPKDEKLLATAGEWIYVSCRVLVLRRTTGGTTHTQEGGVCQLCGNNNVRFIHTLKYLPDVEVEKPDQHIRHVDVGLDCAQIFVGPEGGVHILLPLRMKRTGSGNGESTTGVTAYAQPLLMTLIQGLSMTFFESPLPLAERGFRVFPLIPGKKQPFKMATGDHFDAATTAPEQIRLWDTQEPNANVGLSPDENFCFLETDDESALMDACKDLPAQRFDTNAGPGPIQTVVPFTTSCQTTCGTRNGRQHDYNLLEGQGEPL